MGNTNTYIRKKSGVVELQIRFTPLIKKAELIITNLPKDYRPLSRIVGIAQGLWETPVTKEGIATFIILPDGEVNINSNSDETKYPNSSVVGKEMVLRAVYLA